MLQPISEIESWPVNWLWPGRLALGKLSILDGARTCRTKSNGWRRYGSAILP
jgi:hypothetical protein